MHWQNRVWWEDCEAKYSAWLHKDGGKALEVGSYDINGSVRFHFQNFSEYIGVDWRAGPSVDKVCFAHEMAFDHKFDVVISSSMLEHDRHWEKSIPKMVECVSDDGILLLSWGAALNRPHELDTADDGKFHKLPAGYVLKALADLGVYVHEFRYESNKRAKRHTLGSSAKGTKGCVGLVAFMDEKYAVGDKFVADLIAEDRI